MSLVLRATARVHALRRDDDGLTMLAYALGAAIVVVPIAIAMFGFGDSSVDTAQKAVDGAIGP